MPRSSGEVERYVGSDVITGRGETLPSMRDCLTVILGLLARREPLPGSLGPPRAQEGGKSQGGRTAADSLARNAVSRRSGRVHEGPPPGQNARQLGGVKMPRPHRERDRMAPVSRATGPRQFLLRPYNRWHILKKFKVLLLAEGLNILNAENPRAGGGGVMRRVLWLGRMKMLCLTPPIRTYIGFVEGRSPCVDSPRLFLFSPR